MWIKSVSGGLINMDKLSAVSVVSGEVRGFAEISEGDGSYCVFFRGSDDECQQYIDGFLLTLNNCHADIHRIAESVAGICTILDSGVITVHDQYDV